MQALSFRDYLKFKSNHNIHKSLRGLCFGASDFYGCCDLTKKVNLMNLCLYTNVLIFVSSFYIGMKIGLQKCRQTRKLDQNLSFLRYVFEKKIVKVIFLNRNIQTRPIPQIFP